MKIEPRVMRITAFAISAIILFGSFSIWAVSTQERAIVGVGEIFEAEIEPNEELEGILEPTTGVSGNIEEDKHLFDINLHEDYPREKLSVSIHLYNSGEVEEHLQNLAIEMKAENQPVGNLTLSNGRINFVVERDWDDEGISINTTGEGSYNRKESSSGLFDLHFMIQIDEVQEGVRSEEDIESEMFELEISSTEGGDVTEPGEGIFEYETGTIVDLEAIADEDTPFVEWTGDNETIEDTATNQTTIEMLDDYSITAVFDVVTYDLTISSNEGGSVVEPGEGTYTYNEGEIVDLEAVAEEGYQFVEWAGQNETIEDPTANQTTIEMLDNYSITAEFAPISYELTLDSTDGGDVIEPGEGTFEYEHGSIVDLEAVADEDTPFIRWSGDNETIEDTTANQTTIEMLDNYSITAVFDVETYDLTIESTEGGFVVEPGESTFTYDAEEIVDLEAIPEEGYQFVEWTGDNETIDDTTENQTTIEMLDDYSITAEFEPITYELITDSTEGGSVTEPGEGTFEYSEGTIVDLKAVADEGYTFIEWTGDTATIEDPTSNQTTIEMLDNYAITGEFLQDPFFEVEIVDYDDPVVEGQTLEVDYTVTNTGEMEDTQDIEFTVEDQDGNIVRSVTDNDVTLGPGATYEETFTWTTDDGDSGEYDVTVASEDDEEVVTISVYGTAMEVNDDTQTYTGDPAEWETHWEETNIYVGGLDEMDLVYHYELAGTMEPGGGAEAGVRILMNGDEENPIMEDFANSEEDDIYWEGTANVEGMDEVDIQFQYYTESQGWAESEVTIYETAYEYVDTTTTTSITEFTVENDDSGTSALQRSEDIQNNKSTKIAEIEKPIEKICTVDSINGGDT